MGRRLGSPAGGSGLGVERVEPMKVRHRIDTGLVVVLAICLLAIWPFISRPGLPLETDAELHIFRTAELSHLLQGGAVFPRWAPDFYFGYGYPLYNYYASLTYYLGAGLMTLPGVDAVLAVKLVFLLGFIGCGLGIYSFVRTLWGRRSAVVAAAVYLYAPYIQYIDPHARGVLAEFFSFALFPWVLWAFTLPPGASRPDGRRLSLAALLLAALIYTHNLMALVFTAFLVAWLTWQILARAQAARVSSSPGEEASPRKSKQLAQALAVHAPLLLALGLGVALAAFFWLPVVLERDAVQLGNLISNGGHFDFRNHFLSWQELLKPTIFLDLGATDPGFLFNLGVAQWVLGLMGGGSLLWRKGPRRLLGLFFVLAAALLLLLILPVSSPIWGRVPLMPYLQFPWRLLGPVAFCLAVLSGIGVAALERLVGRPKVDWAVAGLVVIVLTLALPLSYPPDWPAEFGPTDPLGIMQRELKGRWLGTTSTGDYVPADVLVVPRPEQQVVESYQAGGAVDRVNRATLPKGTSVRLDRERPLGWVFQVDGDEPFVFRLFHFYFPGWVAILDGEPVDIEPAKPDGFITVMVPAGAHQLEIVFRQTPARTLAWSVSGLALAACLLVTLWLRKRPAESASPVRQTPVMMSVVWIPLVLMIFKLALADPLGWFRVHSEGLEVEGAQQQVYYELQEEVALIGYDWHTGEPGETARLVLYWKAIGPPLVNYQVFVHLRDGEGAVVAQSDKLNPGDYPTKWWGQDKYVRDVHLLSIPADLAPGVYRLAVGMWVMETGERLSVTDKDGNRLGDSIWLESQVIQ